MTIWVNTIVNNEEYFIWFAILSVLDYVDRILVWDTGSTDKTVEIIKTIGSSKIKFQQVGKVNAWEFTKMRQKMLEQSKCDWILILDGDEVWWEKSIKKIIDTIKKRGTNISGIVVPMIVPVGDIYHIQDEKAGRYKIMGKIGHLSLKGINRNIKGLHVDWPYGQEGYFDADQRLIQDREDIIFLDAPFLHVTHLKRSSKHRRYDKFKYELGKKVSEDFKFPEVFNKKYPAIVPSPKEKISGIDLYKAKILTPLRKVKRKFL